MTRPRSSPASHDGLIPRWALAVLCACVGVMFLVHWLVADPSYEISETQDDWAYVLGFSAAILSLAFAIPMFARLAIGRVGFRVSLIAGAGAPRPRPAAPTT